MARVKKTERERATEFAVLLPVVFGIFAALAVLPDFLPRLTWWEANPRAVRPLLIAGPVVCLIALVLPWLWLRVFRLWMKLAEGLSWVMTRVILSVFYFLVLTPVSLVMRLLGKAPLDLAWHDGKSSYWIEKSQREASLDTCRKQF